MSGSEEKALEILRRCEMLDALNKECKGHKMDRKEKRLARRSLRYRIATLFKVVSDPVAKETGCNIEELGRKLKIARRSLRALSS